MNIMMKELRLAIAVGMTLAQGAGLTWLEAESLPTQVSTEVAITNDWRVIGGTTNAAASLLTDWRVIGVTQPA